MSITSFGESRQLVRLMDSPNYYVFTISGDIFVSRGGVVDCVITINEYVVCIKRTVIVGNGLTLLRSDCESTVLECLWMDADILTLTRVSVKKSVANIIHRYEHISNLDCLPASLINNEISNKKQSGVIAALVAHCRGLEHRIQRMEKFIEICLAHKCELNKDVTSLINQYL